MARRFDGLSEDVPRHMVRAWLSEVIGYKPHAVQRKFHDAIDNGARFLACNEGRQTGKTLQAAVEILVEMAYKPLGLQRFRYIVNVAPEKDITKRVFDYVHKWIVRDRVFGCKEAGESDHLLYIETPWGSRLDCKTTNNPDAMRGEGVVLAVLDEDAFMPDNLDVVGTYINPIIGKNRGRLIRISTPNGTDNHWYYDWHNYAELMKTNKEYFAMHATTFDNPHYDHELVETAKKEAEMKGEDAVREWEREWLAAWTCVTGMIFTGFKRSVDGKEWHVRTNLEPKEGAYIDVGLDFGHSSSHPLGLVFGTHWGNEIDVYRCVKSTVFRDCEIADYIKSTWQEFEGKYGCKRGRVFGDPSRDASLDELRFNDIFVYKGKKEVNDVKEGLACLRNMFGRPDRPAVRIDSSCIDLIKEIDNYQYKEDGIHPVKMRDDLVDALRYFAYGGTLSTTRDLIWA